MKANFSKTSLAFVGALIYLFLLVPFFIIWIPYEILSSSGHDIEFNNGVFQHVGLVFIAPENEYIYTQHLSKSELIMNKMTLFRS